MLEKMEEGDDFLDEDEAVAGWNVRQGSGAGGLNGAEGAVTPMCWRVLTPLRAPSMGRVDANQWRAGAEGE
jgi:hypothetical protein